MVQGVSTLVPSLGYALNLSSGGGRESFAVAPSAVIYAQFKHISGVAAPDGQRGVSLARLQLLDLLIEKQSEAGKAGRPESPAASYRRPPAQPRAALLDFFA